MFSRTGPGLVRGSPEHDPIHLRIATAVVVLGLLAGGVAVLWVDMVLRGAVLAPGATLTSGAPASAPDTILRRQAQRSAGLRLLAKAAIACTGLSYQGIQIVAWDPPEGSRSAVITVWHRRDQETLIEPMAPAEPAPLNIVPHQIGRANVAPGADADGSVEQRDPVGMMGVTRQMVALLGTHYLVSVTGTGQVAGRSAQVITVRKADGQLAAMFWLDNSTNLPLRREIFDTRSRLVSEDAFLTIKVGAPAVAGAPTPVNVPRSKPLTRGQIERLRGGGWPVPGQLPGNLSLVTASETGRPGAGSLDLAYSDGLSVVSLFVQRGHLPAQLSGWSPVAVQGKRVLTADPDQRSVAWSAGGFVYTVIADAPQQTVTQVVAALPHDQRPGFFGRLANGLHRLGSWLNPFR
jgi:sigma-E factor negative regulatory protein RseB